MFIILMIYFSIADGIGHWRKVPGVYCIADERMLIDFEMYTLVWVGLDIILYASVGMC